jgi:hypothetical protein
MPLMVPISSCLNAEGGFLRNRPQL